jgi:hypothetical protein
MEWLDWMPKRLYNTGVISRAEAVLIAPSPALTETPAFTGVRLMIHFSIPSQSACKPLDCFRLEAV